MSRYMLIPKLINNDESKTETFSLVPTEGFNGQIKELDLPLNIVPKQKHKNLKQKKSVDFFYINWIELTYEEIKMDF